MNAHDPKTLHPLMRFFASRPGHKRSIGALVVKYLNGLGGQDRVLTDSDFESYQADIGILKANITTANWRKYFHTALKLIKTLFQLSPRSPRSQELWALHSCVYQLANTRNEFLMSVQNMHLKAVRDRVAAQPR